MRRRLDLETHGSDGFTTPGRVAGIAAAVVFLGVGLHLALGAWYSGRIMPGVVAAGHRLGEMNVSEARQVLQREAASYRLDLTVAGQRYELTAAQLGVQFDPEATLSRAYKTNRGAWLPLARPEPVAMSYRLDRTQLSAFTASVAAQVGVQPVDAAVVIKNGKLETVPDKSGITVDKAGLQRLIERDLQFPGSSKLTLQPRPQVADIQVHTLAPTLAEAERLMATPIVLTYNDRAFTPTARDIGQWLAFEKKQQDASATLVPKVDITKLRGYVLSVANKVDVAAVPKKVNVENGVSRVTQEGVNGLAINQDLAVAAVAEAVAKNQPLTFAMTSREVAFKTLTTNLVTLDYPKYVEINLKTQRLWVWEDKKVIHEAPITSGATGAGFPTVTGLFSIYSKVRNTHLIGNQYGPRYNYDVFVKYWMPFHSGYGLHDASWRNGRFGGQDYYYGGSHGCVNLPDATAAFVFNWASVGTPVWVHK